MATATQSTHKKERGPHLGKGADQRLSRFLDAEKRSATACQFEHAMRKKIVGQDEPCKRLLISISVLRRSAFSRTPRGESAVSGTHRFRENAHCRSRGRDSVRRQPGGNQSGLRGIPALHEIAKLIGSPPGYLGHRETHPLITQEALAASHRDHLKLSFLLFDEIEKASNALWQLLLGMLDKATLTLGDNRKVDLSQTVIFLTSNLGGSQIADLMHGGMGFIQPKDKATTGLHEKVQRTAVEAARRKFSPEFMNRLDKVVVFHPLKREELDEVLDIELRQVQKRVLDSTSRPFLFRITSEAGSSPGRGNRPTVWGPPPEARH